MFAQVTVFAVHRDHHFGAHDVVHLFQIGTVRVARHVIKVRAIIHHIDVLFRQVVHDTQHFALIARNGF